MFFDLPFRSVERNDFSNFGKGSTKQHFCEIILKSVHGSRRRCHLNVFLFLDLTAILFSGAVGHPNNTSVKLFLQSVHWSRRRCHLNVFLFSDLAVILFRGAEGF